MSAAAAINWTNPILSVLPFVVSLIARKKKMAHLASLKNKKNDILVVNQALLSCIGLHIISFFVHLKKSSEELFLIMHRKKGSCPRFLLFCWRTIRPERTCNHSLWPINLCNVSFLDFALLLHFFCLLMSEYLLCLIASLLLFNVRICAKS